MDLGSEGDALNDPSSFVGCFEDEIRAEVAWAHLNMTRGSWGFADESHALGFWIIMTIEYKCI